MHAYYAQNFNYNRYVALLYRYRFIHLSHKPVDTQTHWLLFTQFCFTLNICRHHHRQWNKVFEDNQEAINIWRQLSTSEWFMSDRSSGLPLLLPVSGWCVVVKQRCCSRFDWSGVELQHMKKEPVSPCHSRARRQTAGGGLERACCRGGVCVEHCGDESLCCSALCPTPPLPQSVPHPTLHLTPSLTL